MRTVLIGVGNEFRRDDGAGQAVLAVVRERVPPAVEIVVTDGEPIRLLEAWTGADLAVVVDTVTGGTAPAGTLHRLVIGADGPRRGGQAAASSHGLGVGEAVALARVLGRMPGRLIVHAVQAADLSQGPGLSGAVAAVIEALARAVLADLGEPAAR